MRKFFAKMLLGSDTLNKLHSIQQSEALEEEAGKRFEDAGQMPPKVSSPTITREQIRSLIEIDMEIHGDIFIGRGVKISGRVMGNLIPNGAIDDCDPIVIVSQGGDVCGDLHARVVVVAGSLDGDIHADHVLLMPTAKVSGTVNYRHTLRQDIGSALSGMVRRVEAIALLDQPPRPGEAARAALQNTAAGRADAIPVLPVEPDSVVAPLVRAVPAAQDTAEIESLYRGLDVARENPAGGRVVALGA
ncbi:bactofilin family protein [Chromobacterium subtsugae]|uniref:bactofilin family protein n=1 Tax=Chromobacterium subtsugae TaxID=251747 RepID=UPI0006415C1E|nr:polymer-forming cytoskeletal protein [Chromobacterium subtsugae]